MQSRLTFYTDDATGNFRPTYKAVTACDSITNLVGVKVDAEYVVTYLCHNRNGSVTLQTQSLILHPQDRGEWHFKKSLVAYSNFMKMFIQFSNLEISIM